MCHVSDSWDTYLALKCRVLSSGHANCRMNKKEKKKLKGSVILWKIALNKSATRQCWQCLQCLQCWQCWPRRFRCIKMQMQNDVTRQYLCQQRSTVDNICSIFSATLFAHCTFSYLPGIIYIVLILRNCSSPASCSVVPHRLLPADWFDDRLGTS